MEKVKAKVLGLTKGISKKGNKYVMLNVSEPFVQVQIENGSVGMQANSYFLDNDLMNKVDNSCVGKEIVLHTVFAGGKKVLCDITV